MRRYPTVPTGNGHEIVQTGPSHCTNGHLLTLNVIISHQKCLCTQGESSHNVWQCLTCGDKVVDPPAGAPERCSVGRRIRSDAEWELTQRCALERDATNSQDS